MEWKKFLVKFYNEKKEQDPEYKFKDAMKAAKVPYRKQLSGGADPIPETAPDASMGGGKKRSRKQLSGGEGEGEVAPSPAPPAIGGGKKSKSKRYSKRRRTSKKR
jgi:hypothetical protein